MSEPEGRGAAWTDAPKGRGAAWTEERRARNERRATREGGALSAPEAHRKQSVLAAVGVLGVLLAGCGGSGSASSTVPSLSQPASGAHASGGSHATELHAAAQCIRQHGVPEFQDPVLSPTGAVYSDSRSLQNVPQSTFNTVIAACGALAARAGLHPGNEPPAPPLLVQAGVRAAECERAHGLPNVHDPTARSPYTPGHGFGLSGNEVPAGGKASHGFQDALHACHSQISAEIRASTLSSLGSDG
jgi:hypothetical protein